MFTSRRPRVPAWHRDVTWIVGLVAVVAVTVACAAFAWWRLAGVMHGPAVVAAVVSEQVDRARGDRARVDRARGDRARGDWVDVSAASSSREVARPAEEIAVLGSGVRIAATTLSDAAPADVAALVTDAWAQLLLAEGRDGLVASVDDPHLRARVDAAVTSAAFPLVRLAFHRAFLDTGVWDGSREANWTLQAARNPGRPVVPIVGIDLAFDVRQLEGASRREIGSTVLDALARTTVMGGVSEARAWVTAFDLVERFDAGIASVRSDLGPALALAWTPTDETVSQVLGTAVDARSTRWWATVDTTAWGDPLRLRTVQSEDEAVRVLAAEVWRVGADSTASSVGDPDVRRALTSSPTWLAAVTYAGQRRALRLWVSAAALAVAAITVVASLSRGPGRSFRVGSTLVLGAAAGATVGLAAWWTHGHVAWDSSVDASAVAWTAQLLALVPAAWIVETAQLHGAAAGLGIVLWTVATVELLGGFGKPR